MLASGILVIADEQREASRADHLLLLPRQGGGVLRHGGEQQDQAKAAHEASFLRQLGSLFSFGVYDAGFGKQFQRAKKNTIPRPKAVAA